MNYIVHYWVRVFCTYLQLVYFYRLCGDTDEFSGFHMQKMALRLNSTLPSSGAEYVDNFLAINASLLLCEEPSAATILSDI